ncbi:MAG: hypothetical protein HON90_11125, partial [Halobacteriovoraceae bacterium]|nr:hypothetical protein [Halobacteriovoraceae bacterium]
REKRRSEIKNRDKKKKSSKKHDIFKKYNPSEDYQVLQAVKYLKTFKVYRDLNSTK